MLNIPAALFAKYSLLLNKKSVSVSVHNNYKKWLRYYLDFCHKYCHRYADKESLKHFMIKLHEKNQPISMQEEAAKAVAIYYEMLETTPHPDPLPLRGEGKIGDELLGHSDVRTTMIYTHCVPSRTLKEAKSPLDF